MPQAHHKQRQTHAIGQKTHRHGHRHGYAAWQLIPDPQGHRQVDAARHQALDRRDPGGVIERHLARQIVVHTPGKARAQYGQRRPQASKAHGFWPTEHQRPGGNQAHAQRNPPIKVFTKNQPSQQRCKNTLGIEQQRSARCRHAAQAQHQQQRPDHAASQRCPSQPDSLAPGQLDRRRPGGQAVKVQAQARAQVKQARQHPWPHTAQEQLGQRRTGAKQQRGPQGCGYACAQHVDRLCMVIPSLCMQCLGHTCGIERSVRVSQHGQVDDVAAHDAGVGPASTCSTHRMPYWSILGSRSTAMAWYIRPAMPAPLTMLQRACSMR